MSSGSRHVSGELVRAYETDHGATEREFLAQGARATALMQQVGEFAQADRSVLIVGETGTGKTMIAHALHAKGPHPDRPLRVINCAALSDAVLAELIAELDACESADLPALFLDEIGELSPWSQAVLLRRLARDPSRARLRFLAATHRNLDQMVTQGTFSRELLWRLNMARLAISPLRERRDEISPLAMHFLRLGLSQGTTRFVSIQPELFEALEAYDWPGNVRELKNAMLRTLAVNDSGRLGPDDLPDAVRAWRVTSVVP